MKKKSHPGLLEESGLTGAEVEVVCARECLSPEVTKIADAAEVMLASIARLNVEVVTSLAVAKFVGDPEYASEFSHVCRGWMLVCAMVERLSLTLSALDANAGANAILKLQGATGVVPDTATIHNIGASIVASVAPWMELPEPPEASNDDEHEA